MVTDNGKINKMVKLKLNRVISKIYYIVISKYTIQKKDNNNNKINEMK